MATARTLATQFSTDPAQNGNRPVPMGAPESGMTLGQINDVLRVLMGAIAEHEEGLAAVEGGAGAAGTMATMLPNAVVITGGSVRGTTLDNTNSVAVGAIKGPGTLDPALVPVNLAATTLDTALVQALYDAFWPVGSQRFWKTNVLTGLTPPGLHATWAIVAASQDALLCGAGTALVPGSLGTGTTVSLADAGAHAHGGGTGATALTLAQVPASLVLNAFGVTGAGGLFGAGAEVRIGMDLNPGGGQGHGHSVGSDGSHTHAVTMPKRYATYLVERTG